MADHDNRNQASAPAGPSLPSIACAAEPPAALDAHGFDPGDYDWIPVPRQRRRAGGWSIHTQRAFIEALADTGSVGDAARAVGMSVQSCYRLRRDPHAHGFARAWDAAIEQAGKALLDLAFERIIHGEDVPVFDKDGQRIASKRRFSDRLTMFMLRGYFPDRFGGIDSHGRRTLSQPPVVPPVEAALAALEPVCPAEPHTLMPPDDLAAFVADEIANAKEEERVSRADPPPRPKPRMRETVAREEPDWFWAEAARIEAEEALRKKPRAGRRKQASP